MKYSLNENRSIHKANLCYQIINFRNYLTIVWDHKNDIATRNVKAIFSSEVNPWSVLLSPQFLCYMAFPERKIPTVPRALVSAQLTICLYPMS